MEKSLTLSEYLALPPGIEETEARIASALASRLPGGVVVVEVVERRGRFIAECDGVASVLDMIDLAAALNTGVTLTVREGRQLAVLQCRLSGEWVVICEEFDLPEYTEADDG